MYYFPVSGTLLKPLHNRHEVIEAAHTGLPHDEAGVPAKMASANAMVAEAKRKFATAPKSPQLALSRTPQKMQSVFVNLQS